MEVHSEIERAIRLAIRAVDFRTAEVHYPDAAETFRQAARINSARASEALTRAAGAVGAASTRTSAQR